MKKEDLIGRKMHGFKFKHNTYLVGDGIDTLKLQYVPSMDKVIGEVGEIVHARNFTVRVQFSTRDGEIVRWSYPISLIGEHLINEHLIKPKTQEVIFKII